MAAENNQKNVASSERVDEENWTFASDHAWRYFELHASQRMTVFNFFTVLAGFITAGIGVTFQGSQPFAAAGVALGMLLASLAFIFWKLDQRAAFFVKHAEAAQAIAERRLPEATRVFTNEPAILSEHRQRSSFFIKPWTFGSSFRLVFLVAAVIGVSASVFSGMRLAGVVHWDDRGVETRAGGAVLTVVGSIGPVAQGEPSAVDRTPK